MRLRIRSACCWGCEQSSVYEWLRNELAEIKTRKFHLTFAKQPTGRASKCVTWPSPPSASFVEFIRQFGSVMLYRELGGYLVRVFDAPIMERSSKDNPYLVFGGYDS